MRCQPPVPQHVYPSLFPLYTLRKKRVEFSPSFKTPCWFSSHLSNGRDKLRAVFVLRGECCPSQTCSSSVFNETLTLEGRLFLAHHILFSAHSPAFSWSNNAGICIARLPGEKTSCTQQPEAKDNNILNLSVLNSPYTSKLLSTMLNANQELNGGQEMLFLISPESHNRSRCA